MCGIAGYIGKKKINRETVLETLSLMNNRGPDFQNYKEIADRGTNIYLLHARLGIIDLDSRSNQPFELDGCSLVFNGEIYNYVELRDALKQKGVAFKTSSDTEVLLRYYLAYGEKCVEHFEGMWAFAIYDSRNKKLFLSRDRFAEKPLYYYEEADGLYFASEIKFLKLLVGTRFNINHRHLFRHLVNGYQSLYKVNETYFEGIKELRYASNIIVDSTFRKTEYAYWKPIVQTKDMTISQAVEGTRYHFLESMKLRLRSDVPLAFCLSGGIDSSALVSVAAKIFKYDVMTFSILDSDERYNELENIQATLDDIKCRNVFIQLKHEDTLSKLRDLIKYHDAPIPTVTYLIHSYLTHAIAQNGYRVAFSGTAADELFTGGYNHFNLHFNEVQNNPNYPTYLKDWEKYIKVVLRNPLYKNPRLYVDDPNFRGNYYEQCDEFSTYLKQGFKEEFTEERFTGSLMRNRLLNELFHESIPVVLHAEDLNSMYYSIENRSPYLDTKLFEFAFSIPGEYLVQNGYAKYILREAMKGILNDKVRLDRTKKGFNASLRSIINFDDPNVRTYLLNDSPVYKHVDRAKIAKLFDLNPLPDAYNKFLFNFINMKIFLELHT
jgi:asparagine synthase (glutamine-hydrolysing)